MKAACIQTKVVFPAVILLMSSFVSFAADIRPLPPGQADQGQVAGISVIVAKAVEENRVPGAVVVVGHQGKVIYREAFGRRSVLPAEDPMTPDTIFDISSLTKVVATTTAVMQLVDEGKLLLDKPVKSYWPAFKGYGKEQITVRQLLTHYSGLRADPDMRRRWQGCKDALKLITAEKPLSPPGNRFRYSDINFIILGELVQRVSGQPLDVYCEKHIFGPLGMKDTSFNPGASLRGRIAPTEHAGGSGGAMLCGEVHDPAARRMGGVAGHAGLFSTADDLSRFAQMILDGGRTENARILSPRSVEKMTTPQSPSGKKILRGLGWDIDSPFSSCRGALFPVGSFGHTGFTGTSLWIDPGSKAYVIVLTSRLHPGGRGEVRGLRSDIATSVASALGYARPSGPDSVGINARADRPLMNGKVQSGLDVLEDEGFNPLRGLSIGLITNHSGIDSSGKRSAALLSEAPGVKLKALFSPEHGFSGREDKKIPSSTDPSTGLPLYSLYGDVMRPTDAMLEGLDALVFDIQDAGARFYTYISTLGYAMEAAAKKGMAFYVLDRPNPISGAFAQGFLSDDDLRSFTAYFPLPVRHGMTVGELAEMFNTENRMGLKLQVIRMRGYQRSYWFDETGLLWVNPSPNIRSVEQAALYPGVALIEGSNVSVGRGTDSPFELLGAPWIKGRELASYLNKRRIPGVRFVAADFRPVEDRYKNISCHGVRIILANRDRLDSAALGIEIVSALHRLYPKDFLLEKTKGLIASKRTFESIRQKRDPSFIVRQWQESLRAFLAVRSRYLLYE